MRVLIVRLAFGLWLTVAMAQPTAILAETSQDLNGITLDASQRASLAARVLQDALRDPNPFNLAMLKDLIEPTKWQSVLADIQAFQSVDSGIRSSIRLTTSELTTTGDSTIYSVKVAPPVVASDSVKLTVAAGGCVVRFGDLSPFLASARRSIAEILIGGTSEDPARKVKSVNEVISPNLFRPRHYYPGDNNRVPQDRMTRNASNEMFGKQIFSSPFGILSVRLEDAIYNHDFQIATDPDWHRVIAWDQIAYQGQRPFISIGAFGAEDVQFKQPLGICLVLAENYVVADQLNDRASVYHLNSNTEELEPVTQLTNGFSGVVDVDAAYFAPGLDQELAVLDRGNGRICTYNATTWIQSKDMCSSGQGDWQLRNPTSLCYAKNPVTGFGVPYLYVADAGNRRVVLLGTHPETNGNYFAASSYQFPEDAWLTSVDVDPLGYVFVTDGANGVVYEFTPGLWALVATFGEIGTEDGQLNFPNRLRFKDGWHLSASGWNPLTFGDAYVTESFGDQTGIRRLRLGYDILDHEISYTPGPSIGYNDHVTFSWYQSGPTMSTLKLYPTAFDFQSDNPSVTLPRSLLLPGDQIHRFFIDRPVDETGQHPTYYFRAEGNGLFDSTLSFSIIDSISFLRTFSDLQPDTPRIVIEHIGIEDPQTGLLQNAIHAVPTTWYRLWVSARDRYGAPGTIWKRWGGHEQVPAVFSENLGGASASVLETTLDTVYARFFPTEGHHDGDTARLASVKFFWRDSTGAMQQYLPCCCMSSSLDEMDICWYWAWFDRPFTNCALPPVDCSCCQGIVGNVDGDPADLIDISDLSALVDFLFFGGPLSSCLPESDINLDGLVDIADLEPLINYLYFSADLEACSEIALRSGVERANPVSADPRTRKHSGKAGSEQQK